MSTDSDIAQAAAAASAASATTAGNAAQEAVDAAETVVAATDTQVGTSLASRGLPATGAELAATLEAGTRTTVTGDLATNGSAIANAVDARIEPVAEAAAVQAVVDNPEVIDAAAERALTTAGVVTGAVDDSFIIIDEDDNEAFRINAEDGTTHAYDLRFRNAQSDPGDDDPHRFTLVDADDNVALQVREDGTTFIGDPVYGRALSPPAVTRVRLLIGLGQSNMDGQGRPYSSRLDPTNPRIMQFVWGGTNGTTTDTPLVTGSLGVATVPLSHQGGVSNSYGVLNKLADLHAAETGADTVVVVLNCGKNGSALVYDDPTGPGVWKVDYAGTRTHLRAVARAAITRTLALLADRFPGAVIEPWFYWHQMEADATTSGTDYANALDALIADLRTHLGDATIPWACAPTIPGRGSADVIAALCNLPARVAYTAYTDGVVNGGDEDPPSGTTASNQPAGINHYFREALERLAVLMHRAGRRAAVASSAASALYKPLTVTATMVDTTATVTWEPPFGRFINFKVEYSTNGGTTWTTATRTASCDVRQIITGLTATDHVLVRVSTTNDGATFSSPTTPVYALKG